MAEFSFLKGLNTIHFSLKNEEYPADGRKIYISWRLLFFSLIGNCLFWGLLANANFPLIYPDDTLIIGPALGLLHDHNLTNIYISKSFFPEYIYLFYPPTFFWALAAWIRIAGISALPLFWATCGVLASISLGYLLVKFTRLTWMMAAAPILLFGIISYTGYRYEILGTATFYIGLSLSTNSSPKIRTIGYFFLFVTPTIATTLLACSAVAACAIVLESVGNKISELTLAAIGFLFAVAVLILGTHGDVENLIRTMYEYRSVRIGPGGRNPFSLQIVSSISMLSAALIVRIFSFKQAWCDLHVRVLSWVLLALVLTVGTHMRPAIRTEFNIAAFFLCVLAVTHLTLSILARFHHEVSHDVAWRSVLPAAFCILLIALNANFVLTRAPEILSPRLKSEALRRVDMAPLDATIIVDERVMEALNYPIGRKLEDSMVRIKSEPYYQDIRSIPQGEYWIITSSSLYSYTGQPINFEPNGLIQKIVFNLSKIFITQVGERNSNEKICSFSNKDSFILSTNIETIMSTLCSG